MTDERIKEELSNIVSAYMRNPCGEKIDSVLLPYIRAAERLAKIEALEEVKRRIHPIVYADTKTDYWTGYQQAAETIDRRIYTMIAELKEEGE
jgi:hypothetical protein